MNSSSAKWVIAAIAGCALPALAAAGERISRDGTDYFTGQTQVVSMEDGHALIFGRWEGIMQAKDPSAPFHLGRLVCSGLVDARKDGTFDANGYCLHIHRDGTRWVGKWWNNSKMSTGRFEVFYGDGKWSGATGGGSAKCTDLNPSAPMTSMACEVTGMIELKQ